MAITSAIIPCISQAEIIKSLGNLPKHRDQFSYWFPAIMRAGVPYPETVVVRTTLPLSSTQVGVSSRDSSPTNDELYYFSKAVAHACNTIGSSVFLRTGVFSGKHLWDEACSLPNNRSRYDEYLLDPYRNIMCLISLSQTLDLEYGLEEWIIRRKLNLTPAFTSHSGMPIVKERRYFVRDGEVTCHHPRLTFDCIKNPSVEDWKERLENLNKESAAEVRALTGMSRRVARNIEGAWSLDWMYAEGQWWAIDMEPAETSFHWPECPNCKESIDGA